MALIKQVACNLFLTYLRVVDDGHDDEEGGDEDEKGRDPDEHLQRDHRITMKCKFGLKGCVKLISVLGPVSTVVPDLYCTVVTLNGLSMSALRHLSTMVLRKVRP